MVYVAASIYISVLFVYTRSSSTENTYLTSSSEGESLGLVYKCLAIFARGGALVLLGVIVDGPGVG